MASGVVTHACVFVTQTFSRIPVVCPKARPCVVPGAAWCRMRPFVLEGVRAFGKMHGLRRCHAFSAPTAFLRSCACRASAHGQADPRDLSCRQPHGIDTPIPVGTRSPLHAPVGKAGKRDAKYFPDAANGAAGRCGPRGDFQSRCLGVRRNVGGVRFSWPLFFPKAWPWWVVDGVGRLGLIRGCSDAAFCFFWYLMWRCSV